MAGDRSDNRASQTLKHAVGMAAAAGVFKGLQVAWKRVTGNEAPLGPDDQQASLGHAIAWTVVMGAGMATARMIAIRYTSRLLGAPQDMTEKGTAQFADYPAAPRP
jgi:hypothetical protein